MSTGRTSPTELRVSNLTLQQGDNYREMCPRLRIGCKSLHALTPASFMTGNPTKKSHGVLVFFITIFFPSVRCGDNYAGRRCEQCTNCHCETNQIQCKVGKWFCTEKSQVCGKKVDCGLSAPKFVNLCNGKHGFLDM